MKSRAGWMGGWCACVFRCATVAVVLLLVGCAVRPQPTALTRASSEQALPFDAAITESADTVLSAVTQMPSVLAGFDPSGGRRSVVLLPVVEVRSGRQTLATARIEQVLGQRVAERHRQIDLLPFQPAALATAQYLMAVTLTRVTAEPGKVPYRLNMALVDVRNARTVAKASALVRDDSAVDMTPLPFDHDSPVNVADWMTNGTVRLAVAAGDQVDSRVIQRLPAAAAVYDAIRLYNLGSNDEALARFPLSMATPPGDMRLLTLIYLINARLHRDIEAEQAFSKVVATGIAARQWSLNFEFSGDTADGALQPRLASAYRMWFDQIAQQLQASQGCLAMVGHTQRMASTADSDALSVARAARIQRELIERVPALEPKTLARGVGARQNLIGTGSGDAVDQPDRRIAFRVVPCP